MLMIALGAALAASEGDGSDPAVEAYEALEIEPASMFVPKNRVAAIKLEAVGGEGILDWEVADQPLVGEALFDGPWLYFVPVLGQVGQESVVVAVIDENGNEAFQTVDVAIGGGGCSHIGGASGVLGALGALLVVGRRRD